MTVTKRNILFFLCTSVTILRGQNIDRALDRANDFYKNGGFAEAIPIYESILSKKPNSNVSRLKLANCYRILSQPDRAAPLYASIIESKEARAQDVLHYGETLMMLGKYDSAKFFYKKYTLMNPDDERGKLLLANVDKVKTLRPLFSEVTVFPFSQNSEGDDNAPALVPRGLVFASDRSQGFKLLKEKNPATGRDFTTVYFAERTGDTSFSEPREFSSRLTSLNRNTSNVTFTADSKTAFFCRNSDIPAKNNAFNMQIYAAEASDTSASGWHHVELQSFCTPETNYMYPSVSPDGKRLFFVAERGDGFGGLDIYMVTRRGNKWSKADNLGNKINTAGNEGFPYAAADGRLYFCSKGHAGYGGYDIFMTEQDSIGNWRTPRNVGAPINSPYDDISICFAKDGKTGAFTSTRGGRGDDIFFFSLKNNLFKKENQISVTNSNTTIYAPTNGEPNVSATAEKKADAPKTEVKKGDAKPQSFSIEADPKPVGSRQPAVGGTQAASDKKPEAASRKQIGRAHV